MELLPCWERHRYWIDYDHEKNIELPLPHECIEDIDCCIHCHADLSPEGFMECQASFACEEYWPLFQKRHEYFAELSQAFLDSHINLLLLPKAIAQFIVCYFIEPDDYIPWLIHRFVLFA